jgi:uncharacterized membrane protein YciS (DUF1049 family)
MQQDQNDPNKDNLIIDKKVRWQEIVLFLVLLFLFISATIGICNNDMHFFSHPGARSKAGGAVFHFRNTAAVSLYLSLISFIFSLYPEKFRRILKLSDKVIKRIKTLGFVISIILLFMAMIIGANDDFYGGPGWY